MEYSHLINNSIWREWPLTKEFIYEPSLNTTGYAIVATNYIRAELMDEISNLGLGVKYVAVFYTKPGKAQGVIHLDLTEQPYRRGIDRCAVNWSITESDWSMNYFKPISGSVDDKITVTKNNYEEVVKESQTEPYTFAKFQERDMELVHSVNWKINPVLVRTDIPHNLEIKSDYNLQHGPGGKLLLTGHRWCASIRFFNDDFDYVKKILLQHYG